MSNVMADLTVVNTSTNDFSAFATSSLRAMECPHCGVNVQMQVVARITNGTTIWMRCPSCFDGVMETKGRLYPGPVSLSTPAGLPDDVERIWEEAMACLSVSAYSSAVMNCRKLLLNVAVSHGLPEEDDKGWSPNFYQAVEHLQEQEIITKKMRPWVDRIKDVGNEANHKLPAISEPVAKDVATFTHQLLVLAYELDHLQAQSGAGKS